MYWSDINLSACHMLALVLSLENKPVEPVSQSVCSQTALWIMRKCSELSSVVVTALYPWSPWNSLMSLGRWFLFVLWIKPRALCSLLRHESCVSSDYGVDTRDCIGVRPFHVSPQLTYLLVSFLWLQCVVRLYLVMNSVMERYLLYFS